MGHVVEVTPTLDTNAYTSGDRLGSIMTLDGVTEGGAQITKLATIVIVDGDKQSQALDILFFDELPTVASADNAAIDITDAQMTDKCVGYVAVAAADFKALANSSVAVLKDVNLYLKPAVAAEGKLYALMVTRGTPTHTAAGLVLKFVFDF